MDLLDPQIRVLQHVPRWSIIRTIRQQSVAEHSYYVALYAKVIAKYVGLDPIESATLIWGALLHDMEEMITGDIPTPSKRRHLHIYPYRILADINVDFDKNVDLGSTAKKVLVVADCFEAIMYLKDEEYMGNMTVKHLCLHLKDQLETICNDLHPELYEFLSIYISDTTRTKLMTEKGWEDTDI